MSEEQIKILSKNGYEVLPSINYIRNKNNDYPIACIEYDIINKKFILNLLKISLLKKDEIQSAENEIINAFNIVKQLNQY